MPERKPFGNRFRGCLRAPMVSAFTALCLLFPVTGPAWALEATVLDHPPAGISPADASLLTPSGPTTVADDSCRPFLNAIRHTSPDSAMAPDTRQSAGKAAAVGLVLGFRFALGPKEVTDSERGSVRFNMWQPSETGGAQALAVAEYRRCRSEQALRSLRDLRWSR